MSNTFVILPSDLSAAKCSFVACLGLEKYFDETPPCPRYHQVMQMPLYALELPIGNGEHAYSRFDIWRNSLQPVCLPMVPW
jgi:hypothetical protein